MCPGIIVESVWKVLFQQFACFRRDHVLQIEVFQLLLVCLCCLVVFIDVLEMAANVDQQKTNCRECMTRLSPRGLWEGTF